MALPEEYRQLSSPRISLDTSLHVVTCYSLVGHVPFQFTLQAAVPRRVLQTG